MSKIVLTSQISKSLWSIEKLMRTSPGRTQRSASESSAVASSAFFQSNVVLELLTDKAKSVVKPLLWPFPVFKVVELELWMQY
jgi:hypothetical protein